MSARNPAEEGRRPRTASAIALFGAACFAVGYWCGRPAARTSNVVPPPALRALAEPPAPGPLAALDSPEPDSAPTVREPVPAHPEDTAATARPSTDSLEFPIPTEEELLERYDSLSRMELIGTAHGLGWALSADCRALLDEQFERGLYRSYGNAEGVPIETPAYTKEGGWQASQSRMVPQEDGSLEVQVAVVRYDDHSNLRARSQELTWLHGLMKKKYGIDVLHPYGTSTDSK